MNWSLVLAASSVIICMLFFLYFRWYIRRRISANELLAEYRTEVHRLIAEIDAATDRDSLLVEDRIKTLKGVIEDTDKRIAVYLRDLDRSRRGQALYTNLGRLPRPVEAIVPHDPGLPLPSSGDTSPRNGTFAGLPADSGVVSFSAPARTPSAGEDAAFLSGGESSPASAVSGKTAKASRGKSSAKAGAAKNSAPAEKPELRVQIAELAAKGNSPAKIASLLKISQSEVDLALSLLRR